LTCRSLRPYGTWQKVCYTSESTQGYKKEKEKGLLAGGEKNSPRPTLQKYTKNENNAMKKWRKNQITIKYKGNKN
jgi:hypothetical protein